MNDESPQADVPMNISLYLQYRRFFPVPRKVYEPVATSDELIDAIRRRVTGLGGKLGILLSGGMDSALVAGCIPHSYTAYTFDYGEDRAHLSEYSEAARYLTHGAEHKRFGVTRDAYFKAMDELICLLQQPVVPHAPAVYLAALRARADGCTHLLTGFSADTRFGGHGHLYKAQTKEELGEMLDKQFANPEKVLRSPQPSKWVLDGFVTDGRIDVAEFLKRVGTEGASVIGAITQAGLIHVTPFTELEWNRGGEQISKGKELVKKACITLYPEVGVNKKKPLPLPYNQWFEDYQPTRSELLPQAGKYMDGKRRSLVYAVERYLALREEHGWTVPEANGVFSD
ncbi:asparagine synthase-related protein [Sulfitobacter sp. HNIBRBA3233]|uniref:asparagine synthase-related protein n=1 Tax=Sulfitobacter marinivivus TaxID=3158558 RepID=UPI0032DEF184